MKKLIAILLVIVMVMSLAACKSKEQKAADKYLKDMEKLCDEIVEAYEDEDEDKLEELGEELSELSEEGEEIYEDLEDEDEDAAEEFLEDVQKLMEDLIDEIPELAYFM